MSPIGFARSLLFRARRHRALAKVLQLGAPAPDALEDWSRSLGEPTAFYLDCQRWFHFSLPAPLRAHRAYFSRERRGFGEDAFHVMWWLIFARLGPREFGEIGVYRGQTLSLAALLQREFSIAGNVTGISPFEPEGDSVSRYFGGLDYRADTLANFGHFQLPPPALVRARSTDAAALEVLRSRAWDCLYIDGNHDYDVARADWEHCAEVIRPGGVVVLDDAALGTRYEPPVFATAGHPGPSRVASEVDRARFREVLQVGHNRVFQRTA